MKKTNKILAKALVIILSLVLITSCVVSSTFAKYVVAKSAKTTVSLQKFGLDIKLEGIGFNDEAEKQNGDSITYRAKNISLIPGDDTYKGSAVKATISGKPVVDANIKIDVQVEYNGGEFEVSNTVFSDLATAKETYVPIAFMVNGQNATYSYNSLAVEEAADKIEEKIGDTETNFTYSNGVASYAITKIGDEYPNVTEIIEFGFMWENNVGGDNAMLFDQIGTWLSNQTGEAASTVTVTYTITVEQAT